MSWETYRLGDILTLKRGHDLPSSIRQDGDVPVVSSSGITGWHDEYKSIAPGIVTGRYGTLGEVFFINENYWPLNTALYVTDFKGSNPRFLYYLLKFLLRNQQSDKAAVPGVNRNVLHELKVKFTSNLVVQELTAEILNTYDDLIENNTRQIQLLEEAARQLYKEWFVRLRFPGHEHFRVVDGVPEGWRRKTLGELACVTMGQSPVSKFYNEVGEGLPFHQGVSDFGDRFVSHRIYSTAYNRIAEPGDILCSVRAPVGRLNISIDKIVIGRGLAAVRSQTDNQSFLFYQLRTHFFKEDLIGAGAIFASVTKKDFESQQMLTPTARLIEDFEELSKPIDKQIESLNLMNKKLQEARDLLLPRLMSGEIRV